MFGGDGGAESDHVSFIGAPIPLIFAFVATVFDVQETGAGADRLVGFRRKTAWCTRFRFLWTEWDERMSVRNGFMGAWYDSWASCKAGDFW